MRVSPFILLCLVATFLCMPIAHTAVALLREIGDTQYWLIAHLLVGSLGFAIILYGLKQQELQGSISGFIGAHLVFIGFFEGGFAFFAKLLNIQPLLHPKTGEVLLAPALQVNEASFFILLPLLLLIYANKHIRCNMMIWLRKRFATDLGKSKSEATNRPFAQIVATETIFVIWTIYSLSLVTLDYRLLGAEHWLSMLIYTGLLAWPLYLSYRIFKLKQLGSIFRYAIPVSILYWTWIEMFASMDMITEFYLLPKTFPLLNMVLVLIAVSSFYWLYQRSAYSKSYIASS